MAHFLVCYDIANPRRLGKVHRRALKYALFVQYSIYYLKGSQVQLHEMLDDIQQVINEAEDDVRAYSVTALKEAFQIGRSWLPDDLILL